VSAERRSWLARRLRRVESDPEVVLEEMEAATQRLRDQAWKINATTRARLIPEESAHAETEEPSTGHRREP
jgi:hypothetical protein